MKYRIESKPEELDIEVAELEGKRERLLEAFRDCQEGRCSCPSDEYKKLESMEIEQEEDKIVLRLKSKPHASFDKSEIDKCLQYMTNKASEEA